MRLPRLLARTAWRTTRFGVRTSTRSGWGTQASTSARPPVAQRPPASSPAGRRAGARRADGQAPWPRQGLRGRRPRPAPDAPTVVLLHGLGASAQLCWFGVLHELSRTHRVVALDQRWHGRGIHSPRFRITDCADDVAALMKTLRIGPAVIAGYSMGGPVAQEVWRRHPERVAGLVLASTSTTWRGHLGEKMFFPVMGMAMDGLAGRVQARVAQHALGLPECPTPSRATPSAGGSASSATPACSRCRGARRTRAVQLHRMDRPGRRPDGSRRHPERQGDPAARQRAMAASIRDAQMLEAPGGHTSIFVDHAAGRRSSSTRCARPTGAHRPASRTAQWSPSRVGAPDVQSGGSIAAVPRCRG